jgi:phosphatidylinositol-4-phosphate 3-kinase
LEFDKAKGNEEPSGKLRPEIVNELGEHYATVILKKGTSTILQEHAIAIQSTLNELKETVQKLVEMYTKTFRVNFSFEKPGLSEQSCSKETIDIFETLVARVCILHRLNPDWPNFEDFAVRMQIFHGTRPIAEPPLTPFVSKSESFYENVVFDSWLESQTLRICGLPREARLVFTLIGRQQKKVENDGGSGRKSGEFVNVLEELGSASLQIFNYELLLAQGTFLLPLWPPGEEKVGPAPDSGSHPYLDTCPFLSVELPEIESIVTFPGHVPTQQPTTDVAGISYEFEDLDYYTKQQLLDICSQDIITFTQLPVHEKEVLWEKRYYLKNTPGALPKVLLAAHSWDYACLPGLYGLLEYYTKPEAMDILQLFLPCFPDVHVRQIAINWLSETVLDDDLVDFLPQLLEALKHETWATSPLAKLLLSRSLMSPRLAHSLYWLLTQSLPGSSPQNTTIDPTEIVSSVKVARYRRRLQMMMRALETICGQALRNAFLKQQVLLQHLNSAADEVKTVKDSSRATVLFHHMERLNNHLVETETPIPLSLAITTCGVDVKNSSYFSSNTFPLKIAFLSNPGNTTENGPFNEKISQNNICYAIYKVGDDLRQDQLTLQMIRVMDKLWLKDGLDMKMITFKCVPTGDKQGLVEMVTEAKTLKEIQVSGGRGVTGSFKDTPVADWLKKYNSSTLEFEKAKDNFTRSCAGYSIATYLLGICDRHNDNIMVKQSGHIFHIDYGKFLGDHQMVGNFKRDRTPFVLTPDMAYVINGCEKKPSEKFHEFVDLCCKGFNVVRKNGNLLLNLFALMASSGIPGVNHDAVKYVQSALLPDLSNSEAAATFARMIEESLSSWFTQWNFFFHNLAQMRFSGANDDFRDEHGGSTDGKSGGILSYVPRTYTMAEEGRIIEVQVYGIQKRYNPEKHYVFILKIQRSSSKVPDYIFRTYKEFCELDSKLCNAHPQARNHSLPKGIQFGRQEISEVAERRKHDVKTFLGGLFSLQEQVAHSDLVYTFFHPILRDQEEANIRQRKLKEEKGNARKTSVGKIQGELKLSIEYRKDALLVMVHHAKDLAMPDGSKEAPNSYVKVYLHPDPSKTTKRKTKVVRRNCHPTFMEMVRKHFLKVSVTVHIDR